MAKKKKRKRMIRQMLNWKRNVVLAYNVISLGEVADFGKINFQLKNKYDAKRKRE